MEINVKVLDECPVLLDYQRDLVRRIDVDHATLPKVAESYHKTSSMVCTQHKKAFNEWVEGREKHEKTVLAEELGKQVFRMFTDA